MKRSLPEGPVSRQSPPELPLFGQIKLPAHVAPGSESSRDAAKLVSVDGECLRVLLWISRQAEPPTRYDVAMAVYPAKDGKPAGVGAACGRVFDLIFLGYLVESGRKARSATLAVTDPGRNWLRKRAAA